MPEVLEHLDLLPGTCICSIHTESLVHFDRPINYFLKIVKTVKTLVSCLL